MDWDMANQGYGPGTMDEGSGCKQKQWIILLYDLIMFRFKNINTNVLQNQFFCLFFPFPLTPLQPKIEELPK